jgi:hypothetical protein
MVINHHYRIGSQDNGIAMSHQHGLCFVARQPLRIVDRSLAKGRLLVDVGGIDFERNVGIAQQF